MGGGRRRRDIAVAKEEKSNEELIGNFLEAQKSSLLVQQSLSRPVEQYLNSACQNFVESVLHGDRLAKLPASIWRPDLYWNKNNRQIVLVGGCRCHSPKFSYSEAVCTL